MDIKIIVATHKSAQQLPDAPIYFPIHVGAENKPSLGYAGDNTGDNISIKNPFYCELTGVYWAWKNLDCDVLGLVHYRRYFGVKNKDFFTGILDKEKIEKILSKYDMILAKPRNYFIENIKTHFYNHLKVFTKIDYIRFLEQTILQVCPEYYDDYEKCLNRTKAHMCNMFIMRKKDFDKYCTWLFCILETMENNHKKYTSEEQMPRIYGFIGELLLDVYVEHNHIKYYEQNVIEIGTQHLWIKAFNFCKRKFLGVR